MRELANFLQQCLRHLYTCSKNDVIASIPKHCALRLELELGLGLDTHLFIKVPRPGDSEVTFSVFESVCHLSLPV